MSETRSRYHSKAYSTATLHASFASASRPCCRKLCGVGKDKSHAGQECMSIETALALPSEDCDRDCDRERFEE
jgi:hypothetical protein